MLAWPHLKRKRATGTLTVTQVFKRSNMSLFAKLFTGIVVAAFATGVLAQNSRLACDDPENTKLATIATLIDVMGNVLVSDAAGMATATDKQRIKNYVRVTTTSRASVTISFDCGCDVRLKENERLDVEGPRQCPALLAAVKAVPIGAPIGAVAASAGVGSNTALLVAGVGVGAILLIRNNRNQSPN